MSGNEQIQEMPLPDFLSKAAAERDWDILIGNGLGLALGEIDSRFKDVFTFDPCRINHELMKEINARKKS